MRTVSSADATLTPRSWGYLVALASTVWWVAAAGNPLAAVAQSPFPQPIPPMLDAPFQMRSEGQDLRAVVSNLHRNTGLRVHLDRRIDPARGEALGSLGPTLADCLDAMAEAAGGEWVVADE